MLALTRKEDLLTPKAAEKWLRSKAHRPVFQLAFIVYMLVTYNG